MGSTAEIGLGGFAGQDVWEVSICARRGGMAAGLIFDSEGIFDAAICPSAIRILSFEDGSLGSWQVLVFHPPRDMAIDVRTDKESIKDSTPTIYTYQS